MIIDTDEKRELTKSSLELSVYLLSRHKITSTSKNDDGNHVIELSNGEGLVLNDSALREVLEAIEAVKE